jgi:hypothetical protein
MGCDWVSWSADLKPPQAAAVKSPGGERCGKPEQDFGEVWLREASASEPLQKCRKLISCHGRLPTRSYETLIDSTGFFDIEFLGR